MTEVVKPNIAYGKGAPTVSTTGDFYKDLLTDTLYFKNESGNWEEKPIKPSVLNPVYK